MPTGASSATPRLRDRQAEATRGALVEAARRLFVEQGFAATGTQAIVAAAGVGTRGALYHHFPDKESLFLAVFEAIQADLGRDVLDRIGPPPTDPIRLLEATASAFLDCVLERPDAQALLRDGPKALGWEAFRSAEVRYGAAPIAALLDRAVERGAVRPVPTGPMARAIVAVLDDAALAVTGADDPVEARAQWGATIDALLDGIAAPKPRRTR